MNKITKDLIDAAEKLLVTSAMVPVDQSVEWWKESCKNVIDASDKMRDAIKNARLAS